MVDEVIFDGFWSDGANTDPGDTPDLRWLVLMDGTTVFDVGEETALTVADFAALGEFDGAGYAMYDAAGVAITLETSPSRYKKVTCDGGADVFGASVSAGSDPTAGVLCVRWTGTLNGSIPWYASTNGGGFNPSGAALGLTIPSTGFLRGSHIT